MDTIVDNFIDSIEKDIYLKNCLESFTIEEVCKLEKGLTKYLQIRLSLLKNKEKSVSTLKIYTISFENNCIKVFNSINEKMYFQLKNQNQEIIIKNLKKIH